MEASEVHFESCLCYNDDACASSLFQLLALNKPAKHMLYQYNNQHRCFKITGLVVALHLRLSFTDYRLSIHMLVVKHLMQFDDALKDMDKPAFGL